MQRKHFHKLSRVAAFAATTLLLLGATRAASAKGVEFGDVVKLIESHYRVKHKSVPVLAKIGIKATELVARRVTRYAEYGSIKFAIFEDQDFGAPVGGADFATAMRARVEPDWNPLVQVRAQKDGEQTYVYTKEAGKIFKVLVVQISRRDATAVQVDVSPEKLWLLIKDPEVAGKNITDEAANDAEQE
jgi:hypothetical protein